MLKRNHVIILCAAILLPVMLFGQGYVQQLGASGNVNWSDQVVRVTGIGAPNPDLPMAAQRASALRVAKQDALRNLLETVKGINLDSETIVNNSMLVSDMITTRVTGAIRGFRVVDTRYMSTGDVEVDVEVPMTGVLMDAVLPQNFGGGVLQTGGQPLCPCCGQPWPAGKPVPDGINLIQTGQGAAPAPAAMANTSYSGLVIDARGLGLRPAMAPRVVDENGDEIYGSRFVERDYAVNVGMVGYEKDISRARGNKRVADNPLVVKGVSASGPNKTDVVISNVDATTIHNAAANLNFLQHCKVMFVLD